MSALLNEDSLNRIPSDHVSDEVGVEHSTGMLSGLSHWRQHLMSDLLASVVVFLVALPLCMGIAIASGVSPALGIITGIIGGIIVGVFAGSPLLVSGPAAGLAVIIWELIQEHSIAILGPIVLLAGIIQMIAGTLKMGQWFRAVSPSVIHGMLAGIGVSIVANQLYVMMDASPKGSGIKNLLLFPAELEHIIASIHAIPIAQVFQPIAGSSTHLALGIGVLTIAIMLLWTRFTPKALSLVPAPLVAVALSSLLAAALHLPIHYVNVPSNLLEVVRLPTVSGIEHLMSGPIFTASLVVAFIASAETLLSAAAVDRMHSGPRTRYDKELFAQGLGNSLCGLLGALPMTGVIARSGANVSAGAKTRGSTIIHGLWLLLFVALLPFVLTHVPIAALAAVLVVIGSKLVDPSHIRKLREFGRSEVYIYFITLGTIVATNLLDGVLIGIALVFAKMLYSLLHLETTLLQDRAHNSAVLRLVGAATFIQLPKLAKKLDEIPNDLTLHVNIHDLNYIDPACLELFENWAKQHESTGGKLILEWETLKGKYTKTRTTITTSAHDDSTPELKHTAPNLGT